MGKRFVICFGMIFLMLMPENLAWAQAGNHIAGFDIRRTKICDPSEEDGVTMVGEPDWDAGPETAGCAAVADGLEVGLGQMILAEKQSGGTEEFPESAPESAAEPLKSDSEPAEKETVDTETPAEDGWVSLGDDWVITYYCPLSCCNDQWAWQTSTQEPMKLHHTIAVDPSVIPYYTHVRIGGLDYEYVAEDCGGGIKGKRIDVLVDNCTIANRLGVDRNVEVWVKSSD